MSANAQTVLLNVDRSKETTKEEWGPNLKKFSHIYVRGAFAASADNEGARIVYGSSVNLALGVRTKIKVSPVYSPGYDIEFQYSGFRLRQEEGKFFPDTIINNVSRLDYSSLTIGFLNRINFDPGRGNFLGTFMDIGISGDFHLSIRNISKNELPDGTKIETTLRNLKYPNNTAVKVFFRIGYSHLSLYASYRLTKIFKPSAGYPELPRVIAGLDLALF